MEIVVKKLFVMFCAVALTACSSLPEKRVQDEKSITAEFMGGDIVVTYTKDGAFESITSAGTARMTSTLPSATEEAFIVASLRARKQLAEFMRTDLESDKFVRTVYNSLQEGETVDSSAINKVNSKIASEVQENVKQRTAAILQGTYVDSKKFDNATRTVRVVIKTGAKDVAAAKSLKSLMGN
jgi:hypothetical protein